MPPRPRPSILGTSPLRKALRSMPAQNVAPFASKYADPQLGVAVQLICGVRDELRGLEVKRILYLRPVYGDDLMLPRLSTNTGSGIWMSPSLRRMHDTHFLSLMSMRRYRSASWC